MVNILILPREELVYKVKRRTSEFKLLMLLEQNNTARMREVVQQFTKPGNPVADAYTRTFSVAKACMLLVKYLKII